MDAEKSNNGTLIRKKIRKMMPPLSEDPPGYIRVFSLHFMAFLITPVAGAAIGLMLFKSSVL